MNTKQRLHNCIMTTVNCIGWFTVCLLMLAGVMLVCAKIDQHTAHNHLSHGYITEKYVDDGHYWYSSWSFGDYSITRQHGGKQEYRVTVKDGDTTDYWTIPEEQWQRVNIGDYIGR